ncbi:aspartate/glutamate racemase family protein [Aquiflexum sp.]|uniref:aspartate/glutamate racemase family protein n=1 Tax=Aquiflexum sp. TaxID=1872584 RepID=UPI003593C59B
MNKKKVAIVHTSFISVDAIIAFFKEIIPEVELINIVDDSLLAEVMDTGYATDRVYQKMETYFKNAALMGVDAIFNQCSSVGEAASAAADKIDVPVLKVDEAMAEEAVKLGRRIAVVATVASTMGPSTRLIKEKAAVADKEVEIVEALVDGALKVLLEEGNRAMHNRMVKEKIEAIQDDVDVIVLAQGSMIVLLPELQHIKKPVLSSPKLGIQKMRKLLFED